MRNEPLTDLWKASRQQWGVLVQRWQEQGRLRIAGWAVLALIVANLMALCAEWKDTQAREHARIAAELRKTQELARQSYWPERALQAEGRLSEYRSHLWSAQNASAARADVQAWLDVEIKKAGLQEARVTVLDPLDFAESKSDARIEVQLRGRFDPDSYGRLLLALESSPHWISIDSAELNNGLSPAINLQLSFHFFSESVAPALPRS